MPSKRRRILQASSGAPCDDECTEDNNKDPRSPQTRSRRKSIRLLAQRGAADDDADAHEADDVLSHSASGPSKRRSSARPAHTATENDDDDADTVPRKRKRRLPFVPTICRGAESAVNATVALTRRLLRVPTAEGSSRHSARLDNKRELLCIEKSCASLSLGQALTIDEEFGGTEAAVVTRSKRRKTSSINGGLTSPILSKGALFFSSVSYASYYLLTFFGRTPFFEGVLRFTRFPNPNLSSNTHNGCRRRRREI